MSISAAEQRKVCERSGSRCAFENCRQVLTTVNPVTGEVVTLGNIAHIVARSVDGPRGEDPMSPADRDRHSNLMLLCTTHHQLVDSKESELQYPKERLIAMKAAHELWVERQLGEPGLAELTLPMETSKVVSTALPVEHMARYVYSAETPCRRAHEVTVAQDGYHMMPFVLHDGRLWAFQNLRERSPFSGSVDRSSAERFELAELVVDPDAYRIVMQLLNRCLNKHTGRKGLVLNRNPRRFYFPLEPGSPRRTERYEAPPNGRKSDLNVAWQPVRKSTGEPRPYWLHRAVGLGWVHLGDNAWVLTVRPELHVTEDGTVPYDNAKVGAIVTRWKSSIYNKELWRELSFWRQFLSGMHPRIVLKFSESEAVHVTATFVEGAINWPGLPADTATHFDNTDFEETLLTSIESQLEAADADDADLTFDDFDGDEGEDFA